MEELQDAIEDAQYVNAISNVDEGPRPVLPWEIPTEEQLAEWKSTVRAAHAAASTSSGGKNGNGDRTSSRRRGRRGTPVGEPFTFEWTVSQPLGLFLLSSYLKEVARDYVQINFLEDVARWRLTLRGSSRQRSDKLRRIVRSYLLPLGVDPETGEPKLPERTEIDEYDLILRIPNLEGGDELKRRLVEESSDPTCSECCVGVGGPLLEEMIEAVADERDLEKVDAPAAAPPEPAPSDAVAPAVKVEANAEEKAGDDDAGGPNPADPEPVAGAGNKEEEEETSGPATADPSSPGGGAAASEAAAAAAADSPNDAVKKPATPKRSANMRLDENKVQRLRDDYFDRAVVVVAEGIRSKYWDSFLESEQHTKLMNFLWFLDRKVVEEDFFVMRVLGRGGFGLVNACKKGTSGKLYAMKVMNKKRIKMKKSENLILNERHALEATNSPFIVNLKYSFHSKDDVFLVLDLMTGGDLSFHLQQRGRFSRKECLYYGARIMLGLQALHDRNYVYRDLKPENCLLGEDGRVKITDLGLATKVTPTLHGAAGTRGYWAPEMLRRDKKGKRMPYGITVDWFSYGCCLAEFISGTNPFRSEMALNFGLERGKKKKEEAIDCATLEMDPVFDPKRFDSDAADICRRLLDKDAKTRLGANGSEDIMRHPWFHDVNWESIISDRKRPPFIPAKDVNAASQSEIGTFAEDKTYHETVLDEKDEDYWRNWDWTNPKAFAAEVIEFLIYERETGEPLLPMQAGGTCCCVVS